MKRGKNICNTLKAVRQQIADSNDIAYTPTEYHYEGECAGTCPKCEQEMRYLEQQLDLRRAMGKAVSLVGISVGLAALTSCKTHKTNTDNEPLGGDVVIVERTEGIVPMYIGEKEDVDSLGNCKLAPIATVTDSTTGNSAAKHKGIDGTLMNISWHDDLVAPFAGGKDHTLNSSGGSSHHKESMCRTKGIGRKLFCFLDNRYRMAQIIKRFH